MTVHRRVVSAYGRPVEGDQPTWVAAQNRYLVGGASPFDPTTLNPTVHVRASYPGGPWAGVGAAAGLTQDAPNTTIGPALNGLDSCNFQGIGTQDYFRGPAATTAFDNDGSSVIVICKPTLARPNNALAVLCPGISTVFNNALFTMAYSDAGLRVSGYDGAYHELTIAAPVDDVHLFAMRIDGVNIGASVDGDQFEDHQTACGNITFTGSTIGVGSAYNVFGNEWQGYMWEYMAFDYAITSSDLNNVRLYSNWAYGTSFPTP